MSIAAVMLALQLSQAGGVGKLIETLTKEASAFAACATHVHTDEVLVHRAMKDNGKWKEATVVSKYSFASPRERSAAVREIRLIQSVNGRSAKRSDSLDMIAMSVSSGSDQDRRKMIEQLEKNGVTGVATDLGQLLLLFSEASVNNYEFAEQGLRMTDDNAKYAAYSFRQIDGKEAMTVFRAGEVAKPRLTGEVWLREDGRIFRVSLNTMVPGKEKVPDSMQEMTVDYAWFAPQGCSLPMLAEHREFLDNEKQIENKYTYKPYQTFGKAKK